MRHLVEHSNVLLRPGEEGVARHTPVSLLVHGHGAPLANLAAARMTLPLGGRVEGVIEDLPSDQVV